MADDHEYDRQEVPDSEEQPPNEEQMEQKKGSVHGDAPDKKGVPGWVERVFPDGTWLGPWIPRTPQSEEAPETFAIELLEFVERAPALITVEVGKAQVAHFRVLRTSLGNEGDLKEPID